MSNFPESKLDRLAHRIFAGEVVFFIGAGFSVDSEGNTTGRLISRLLARFLACVDVLNDHNDISPQNKTTVQNVKAGLCSTFYLKEEQERTSQEFMCPNTINKLSDRYYDFNDWICSAFSELLQIIAPLYTEDKDITPLINDIQDKENYLHSCYYKKEDGDKKEGEDEKEDVILPIKLDGLLAFKDHKSRGKALFLDTMGFANPEVMGGKPLAHTLHEVSQSYGNRLLPRHDVLARFAREGLCPTLLTTNYDLLLEGAYRLSGFDTRDNNVVEAAPLSGAHRYFNRIASPVDFFGQSNGYRSAHIVKMHGCTDAYRSFRNSDNTDHWEAYLPAMVFTYREIQNWREDAWSRDYLRTLLRTHTIVFCSYSGKDPVLHDTFRTVYEEMTTQRARHPNQETQTAPEDARVFAIDTKDQTDFHCFEILRAAEQAAGVPNPPLLDHPNYLPFHFYEDEHPNLFPCLDDLFLWLHHRTTRLRQQQALNTDLRRVAARLLAHPCPEAEAEAIRTNFDMLCQHEQEIAQNWNNAPESRQPFEHIVGWTNHFHTKLMRELASGEVIQRNQGPGNDFHAIRRTECYYAFSDHPDWTAWGVVLELAIRHMVAEWQTPLDTEEKFQWLSHSHAQHPTLFFSQNTQAPTPTSLTILLDGFTRPGQKPPIPGVPKHSIIWSLQSAQLPWPTTPNENTPSPQQIWQWASLVPNVLDPQLDNPLTHHLGKLHDAVA